MLHYQIDVSTSVPGVNEKFLQKCFEEKLLVNRSFYELPTRYEAVVRVASLSRKPNKIHHYVFLRNNIGKIDLDIFEDSNQRSMVEEFIRSNS